MKRFLAILAIVLIAGGLIWIAWRGRASEQGSGGVPPPAEPVAPPAEMPSPPLKEDLANHYLQGYAAANSDAARDLVLVGDVLNAFLYTIKVPDALPTAGNREIMAALAGDNPYRIRFLDPSFDYLNSEGELEDRWGTPLYFHFVDAANPAIRSAGPDRKLWTDDDVLHGEYAGEAND